MKRIDVEGQVVFETPYEEVAGIGDRIQVGADPLADQNVDGRECEGEAFLGFENAIEETVFRIAVVIAVASETEFVKEHPINNDASFAWRARFDEQLAAAIGDRVEMGADQFRSEVWVSDAANVDHAGFQLVIQRLDEGFELLVWVGVAKLF